MNPELSQTDLATVITQAVAVAFEAQLHIDSQYHKKHHEWIEHQIEHEKARAAFWKGLAERSIPAIVWLAISAAIGAIWHFATDFIHIGPK